MNGMGLDLGPRLMMEMWELVNEMNEMLVLHVLLQISVGNVLLPGQQSKGLQKEESLAIFRVQIARNFSILIWT